MWERRWCERAIERREQCDRESREERNGGRERGKGEEETVRGGARGRERGRRESERALQKAGKPESRKARRLPNPQLRPCSSNFSFAMSSGDESLSRAKAADAVATHVL
eukprot:4091284-Pleurochrysis_carterae.AAC.1